MSGRGAACLRLGGKGSDRAQTEAWSACGQHVGQVGCRSRDAARDVGRGMSRGAGSGEGREVTAGQGCGLRVGCIDSSKLVR